MIMKYNTIFFLNHAYKLFPNIIKEIKNISIKNTKQQFGGLIIYINPKTTSVTTTIRSSNIDYNNIISCHPFVSSFL